MKNYKILYLALILAVSGCVKLDEVPMSTISPENFYNTKAQVESAYTAAMNSVWGYWYGYGVGYQAWDNTFYYDDHAYGGDLVISPYAGNDFWGYHYKALININTALKAVLDGKVQDGSKEDIDQLVGEAKFLRAYNYFMLVRLFGKVPLYTEGDNPGLNPEPRASVAEVYALIVSDLQDAALKLPDTWAEEFQGRPTNGAANGLLAKVYITMATAPLNETSNYALAAAAAKKVMDAKIYSLVPDVNDVFKYEHKYGPEMMWSYISTTDDGATDGQEWTGGEEPYEGWGDITCEDSFALQYPVQPRRDAYLICYNADSVYYTEWEVASKRPGIKKYLYGPIEELYAYRIAYNIPIIRYADVLLLYAEAANMANGQPTQEAVDALNAVIKRANGDWGNEALATIDMDKQEFDDKVIEERSLELCFEYDRWFDICRKRILEKVTANSQPWAVVNFSDDDYLFPVPFTDLRLNPLLLPQNPGYPDKE
jgi:starch-binding outer membrane protein, SusD/RagB family